MVDDSVNRKLNKSSLDSFREKHLIKVITGVRRSGKSVLMEQYQDRLKNDGVTGDQIISLNFEKLEFEELLDYRKLHDYICERLNKDGWTYVFLDEVQLVEDFQKTVNSLHTKRKVDIYITGSNSHILSGELATLLSGRYIIIHTMPLSFNEYMTAKGGNAPYSRQLLQNQFNNYIKHGGFPQTLTLTSRNEIYSYLDSVYNTIIVKDICEREKSIDVGTLVNVTKLIFHNIGSFVTSTTLTDTLTPNKRKISYNTVEKYIHFLKSSYIIYEVGRYDVKGKQHLKQTAKYYTVDVGLRNMLLSNKDTDIGHILENIVFLELKRRGCKISVGKNGDKEIDFVATKDNGTEYYQVAASVLDPSTLAREIEPLKSIKDHFPKYLITLDEYTADTAHNGIRIINAIDFCLSGDSDNS